MDLQALVQLWIEMKSFPLLPGSIPEGFLVVGSPSDDVEALLRDGDPEQPVLLNLDPDTPALGLAPVFAAIEAQGRAVCAVVLQPSGGLGMGCSRPARREERTWFVRPETRWGDVAQLWALPDQIVPADPRAQIEIVWGSSHDRVEGLASPAVSVELYRAPWPRGVRGPGAACTIDAVIGPGGPREISVTGCPEPYASAAGELVPQLGWGEPGYGMAVVSAPVRFQIEYRPHHRAVGWDFSQSGIGNVVADGPTCGDYVIYLQNSVVLAGWLALPRR